MRGGHALLGSAALAAALAAPVPAAEEELALPAGRMAWTLLGFNAGVEAGQGLVVAALLPVMIWARRAAWEPRAVRLASFVLALTGSMWFVQRLFFA